ncbi:MAG: AMP-binding protein, partial [Thiohalobacterales bacterium]|nr:AMP-binding protein [Thiohalobacterales bacterium]
MTEPTAQGNGQDALLLELIRELALELHPRRRRLRVTLDSTLDRELGFDSLSRVELLRRIERGFAISLPEQVLAGAETPRDLLQAISSARVSERAAARPMPARRVVEPAPAEGAPETAATLLEVLDWHVLNHPARAHVYLYGDGETPEEISYAALLAGAEGIAAGLREHGLQAGQHVALMLPTGREYLFSFFGVLLAGGVPVPIYPPARPSQIEDHLRRHAGILDNARTVLLITVAEARPLARLLRSQVRELRSIVTPQELASDSGFQRFGVDAGDVAFLQYTSGSTGQPKGVILTHADLLANIRAMGEVVRADASDVFVSWLPLYHDMGLIGAWLGSLYYACPLVLMSPLAFLTRPHRWLWAIHTHGGTLSAAPNFAYELCLSKIDDSELEGLALGSWRRAFNGAEPVSPQTIRHFTERFARYGFRPEAMAPVYGLAEAAVGLAFPPHGRGPLVDRIDREVFVSSGRAVPAQADDSRALEFVACGQPLPGYQMRIIDTAGHELPEREEGRLEFRGPSATRGYYRNPDATRKLFDGDWLDSGDLGYIAGGDIYLTSRSRDIIIRAGRNIYPYEVEEAVGNIPGVRKGCVAVFGSTDADTATERVIVLAESRETDATVLGTLQDRIMETATDLLGMPPDEVVMATPHTLLKTSSGKIRRAAVRTLHEQGRLGQGPQPVWRQLARLGLASIGPRLRALWRRLSASVYALYAHAVFWILAPVIWLLVVLLPRPRWRWAVMRRGGRLLFRLAGIPLHVHGREHLAGAGTCVVVANHASYLDGP